MKHGTRQERRELAGRVLEVFRDGFEPVVWSARRLDERTYLNLQLGDSGALTAGHFASEPARKRRVKLARSILEDPQTIIRLLKESPAIRAELLGGGDEWLHLIGTLGEARFKYAHFRPISPRLANQMLDSAEQLLRAIDADDAVERVLVLRWRWPGEWPKDAA